MKKGRKCREWIVIPQSNSNLIQLIGTNYGGSNSVFTFQTTDPLFTFHYMFDFRKENHHYYLFLTQDGCNRGLLISITKVQARQFFGISEILL